MKTQPNPTCPKCGRPTPDDAPAQLCPACLFEAAAETGPQYPALSETLKSPNSQEEVTSGHEAAHGCEVGEEVRYFGDYEILQRIAQGGMGIVYKARQKTLNRVVAIKMIRTGEFASETEINRFLAEAEAAANLLHPNIVAIHEVGQHRGQHYFSMDFVDGMNLADRVKGVPMPSDEAARLLITLAEAIQYAHQRGILHRDVKPQNVLLDADGAPRITDFGLAKRLGQESGLTVTGAVVGTPSYMAPEQASASFGDFGPAGDVYALGGVLYFLLTGRPPFSGSTAMETILQVLSDAPKPPREWLGSIPSDLNQICLKCLEKRPDRRYATARQLAEDLGRFLNHEPVRARTAGAGVNAWVWVQKHPWIMAGCAAALLAAQGFLSYGLWEYHKVKTWESTHPGDIVLMGLNPLLILSFLAVFLASMLTGYLTVRFSREYRRYRTTGVPLSPFLSKASVVAATFCLLLTLGSIAGVIKLMLWGMAGLDRRLFGPLGVIGGMVGTFCLIVTLQSLNLLWRILGSHDLSRFESVVAKTLQREQWAGQLVKAMLKSKKSSWWKELTLLESCIIIPMLGFGFIAYWSDHFVKYLVDRPDPNVFFLVVLPLLNVLILMVMILWNPLCTLSLKSIVRRFSVIALLGVSAVGAAALLGDWAHEGRMHALPALGAACFCFGWLLLSEVQRRTVQARRDALEALPPEARPYFEGPHWPISSVFNSPTSDAILPGKTQRWISNTLGGAMILGVCFVTGATLRSARGFYSHRPSRPPLELSSLLPGRVIVPEADNFSRISTFKRLLAAEQSGTNLMARIRQCAFSKDRFEWAFVGGAPRPLNLSSNAYGTGSENRREEHARRVIRSCSVIREELEELRSGARRPYSIGPRYSTRGGVLVEPGGAQKRSLEDLSAMVAMHGSASLALGDLPTALADLEVLRAMADMLRDLPRLEFVRLRARILCDTLQILWEFSWLRPEALHPLDAWEKWLGSTQLLDELDRALRIWEPHWADRRMEGDSRMVQALPWFFAESGISMGPEFFVRRHRDDELLEQLLTTAFDSRPGLLFPRKIEEWMRTTERQTSLPPHRNPWDVFRRSFLSAAGNAPPGVPALGVVSTIFPTLMPTLTTTIRAHTLIQLARISIAIAQHRTLTGSVPANLGQLVPSLLNAVPVDPFDGRPMRYLPMGSHSYVLYSIGWDARDEGGAVGEPGRLLGAGDWVWSTGAQ